MTLLRALLLLAFAAAPLRADEIAADFGQPYPLVIQLASSQKADQVVFETPYSADPPAEYNTILVQGLVPPGDLRLEAAVKGRTVLSRPVQARLQAFKRYPNGRFWARFTVPAGTQPLRLRAVAGPGFEAGTLTIYETELVLEKEDLGLKGADSAAETAGLAVSTVPYVPDPALFVPANAPFRLIRRAAWGALPPTHPYSTHTPTAFTLHHTQGNYPLTYEAAVNEVQFVQEYHQQAKKWIDIGYHFLIDPLGNIYEGRPIGVLGAHVLSRNTNNVGISILGNYHPPANNAVRQASADSFVAVGRYLRETYSVHVSSFYAHREIGKSDCPGDVLYAKKPQLRDLIFTPPLPAPAPGQAAPLPVPAGPAPDMTPAQRRALLLLMNSFD